MPGKPVQPEAVEQLSIMLRELLKGIDEGEMTASTATRYRLEGAVTALGARPR